MVSFFFFWRIGRIVDPLSRIKVIPSYWEKEKERKGKDTEYFIDKKMGKKHGLMQLNFILLESDCNGASDGLIASLKRG